MQEAGACTTSNYLQSHTVVYNSLHSTTAVSLVVRQCPPQSRHASECPALRLHRLQEDDRRQASIRTAACADKGSAVILLHVAVLFERGNTTFTTLGVIDVNLQPKGTKGRKKGKCDDELEGEEAGKEAGKKAGKGEKEDGQDEQVVETATANKENVDPSLPSVPRKRQRRVERTLIERKELSAERTPVLAVVVTDVSAASRQSAVNAAAVCAPVVARMITFR